MAEKYLMIVWHVSQVVSSFVYFINFIDFNELIISQNIKSNIKSFLVNDRKKVENFLMIVWHVPSDANDLLLAVAIIF